MLGRFLNARFVPTNIDVGLLLLRIGTGSILFMRHGWEKISRLSFSNPSFPDPLHIGNHASWTLAMVGDGILSLLLVAGIGTRWIALYSFVQIFVAFAFMQHFVFFGKVPGADHSELMALYLSALLSLMFTGPGRYSVDAALADDPEIYRRLVRSY